MINAYDPPRAEDHSRKRVRHILARIGLPILGLALFVPAAHIIYRKCKSIVMGGRNLRGGFDAFDIPMVVVLLSSLASSLVCVILFVRARSRDCTLGENIQNGHSEQKRGQEPN